MYAFYTYTHTLKIFNYIYSFPGTFIHLHQSFFIIIIIYILFFHPRLAFIYFSINTLLKTVCVYVYEYI